MRVNGRRSYPFTLGVASGDPLPDGVVLWTRLAPEPLAPDGAGGMPAGTVPVQWEVARDERFRKPVRRGIALASCQSWIGGRYAAYRTMTEEDLDLVVHVGDYVYEQAGTHTPADFRLVHAQYKTSVDLQAAYASFPFVAVFDDHEVENNWAGGASQPDGEPSDDRRRSLALRAAAFQAYYEHLPLRRPARPAGPDMLAYRRLRFGTLADLHVLDTRQYRTNQADDRFIAPRNRAALDPARTMTGPVQERWLLDGLDRSPARWNVVAQQIMMAQYDYDLGPGVSINHDQWDGYAAARERLLSFIAQRRPSNPVVLSGDWHSSFVNDLKADFDDPQSETLATEFVGPRSARRANGATRSRRHSGSIRTSGSSKGPTTATCAAPSPQSCGAATTGSSRPPAPPPHPPPPSPHGWSRTAGPERSR